MCCPNADRQSRWKDFGARLLKPPSDEQAFSIGWDLVDGAVSAGRGKSHGLDSDTCSTFF